ncbi:MAG TPA: hypothetical protein DIU00_22000, partial [Phycisphaerales bacterium]|nr:hypothetical protein [Phycisphaerales bacterium]
KLVSVVVRTIPIPITTIGMRLPPNRINGERVAASKPQALGMVVNDKLRLNRYNAWGQSEKNGFPPAWE